MIGIEILMLNDNKLDEIDIERLVRLTRLTTLNLTNNNINFVPPELGNMTHLKYVPKRVGTYLECTFNIFPGP